MLGERGFETAEREEAVARLARAGIVDDRRYAEERARTLADRGAGDDLIRHDLAAAGIASELVDDALELVEPERRRAERIVARRGASPRTARYLAGKGFAEEVAREAVAAGSPETLG